MTTSVQTAERAAAPWIERFARIGYASKAAVYAIVGVLAARAAFGRGRVADSDDALAVIHNLPLGSVLLAIVGLGLIGYAAWQTTASIRDTDSRGSDAKGLALRVSSAFRAFLYGGLGFEAARLAFNLGSKREGGDATTHWTARVLDMPMGRWLVLAAGGGVVAYGIYQLVLAWKAKLSNRLHIDDLTPSQRRGVVAVSRFGIAARGVVFAIVGVSIARAAQHNSAAEAEGATGALRSLTAYDPRLLAVVALGLVAYAVYELLNARYRVIRAS